jgi:beta-glucosidase
VSNTFTVTGTPPSPPIHYFESGALPSDVTFTDNGNGTATISGRPPPGSQGNYGITITAHSEFAPAATQRFRLIVAS